MILIKPVENLPAARGREGPIISLCLWRGTYWVAVLVGQECGEDNGALIGSIRDAEVKKLC